MEKGLNNSDHKPCLNLRRDKMYLDQIGVSSRHNFDLQSITGMIVCALFSGKHGPSIFWKVLRKFVVHPEINYTVPLWTIEDIEFLEMKTRTGLCPHCPQKLIGGFSGIPMLIRECCWLLWKRVLRQPTEIDSVGSMRLNHTEHECSFLDAGERLRPLIDSIKSR